MKTFCAFLRGVNVNGTSMKMAEVCQVFESQNLTNVQSVLATGNIIFSSDEKVSTLKSKLEKAMSDRFSYDAFLFIKTKEEVQSIVDNNPFESIADRHTYILLGNENVESTLLKEFETANKSADELGAKVDDAFYWQVLKGNTLDSSFGKILGKKNLKSEFTSRNINTFEKILKKMSTSS